MLSARALCIGMTLVAACERTGDEPVEAGPAAPPAVEAQDRAGDPTDTPGPSSTSKVESIVSRAVVEARQSPRAAPRPTSKNYAIAFDEVSESSDASGLHVVARVSVSADSERPPELLFRARCPVDGRHWVVLGRAQHEGYGLDWKSDVAAGDELLVTAEIALGGFTPAPPACEIDARFVQHTGRVERADAFMCWRGGTATEGACGLDAPQVASGSAALAIADVRLESDAITYSVTLGEHVSRDDRLATRVSCTDGDYRVPRQSYDKTKLHLFEAGETTRVSASRGALPIGVGECDLEIRRYVYKLRDFTGRRPQTLWMGCARGVVLGEGPCRADASESDAATSTAPIALAEWTIEHERGPGWEAVRATGVLVGRRVVDATLEPAFHVTCTEGGKTVVDETHDLIVDDLGIHYLEPGEATTFSESAMSIDAKARTACEIEVVVASTRPGDRWVLGRRCTDPRGDERPCASAAP